MANTVIALKKSATPLSVPANLANGELAINYADGKLYYKAANGTIASISGNEPNYFGTVNASGTLVVADTPSDVLTLIAGTNVTITGDAVNDSITISATGGSGDVSSALIQANTARDHANAAHASANAGMAIGNAAFDKANTANITADRAFNHANAAFITANIAFANANTVMISAQAAFTVANAAFLHANSGYAFANSIATTSNLAFTHANGAFARANTANITADRAFNHANAAFITANIAFANANTVMISAQAAFTVANSGFLHANSGYAFANSISLTANAAFLHANAAFANGNTVIQTAQSAFNQANISFLHANAAFASANAGQASGNAAQATANASYAFGNSAHSIANLAFAHANAAFAVANTSGIEAEYAFLRANLAHAHANAAFLSSNSVNTYTNSTFVKLTAASQTITGNVNIVGDLTLSGNTFTIDATRLEVDDPLLYLAANNYTSDIVDIGFIANYVNATGQNVHTGLYREHEDKMYYLFQGYDKEPINNHIGALSNNMTLAVLNADLRTSNLVLGGANVILTIGASFNHANAAHASANAGMAIGNGAFASANAGQATANAAFARANTANITADRAFNHANAAFATANVAFANANTVMISAQAAFTVANASFLHANASYAFGNSAHSIANLAFTHANAAFAVANTSGVEAEFAFLRANLAHAHANAAFAVANSALSNTSGVAFNGNLNLPTGNLAVGIATPNTGARLQVYNTTGNSELWITADNGFDPTLRFTGEAGEISNEGFSVRYDNSVGDVYFENRFNGVGAYHFQTFAVEAFTIQTDGKVGVGTTSPGYILDVKGTGNVSSSLLVNNMNVKPTIEAAFAHANAAFASSNADYAFSNSAHSIANLAFTHANAAFAKANAALPSSSYTASDVLSKLLTVDGAGSGLDADLLDGQQGTYYGIATDVTAANRVANAAFLHANASYAFSNSAHSIANLAFTHANNAYIAANTARTVVNDTVNATRYLMFANGTSGTSSLNVAVGLAFTPSSNTLNINGALNAVTKSFVIPHPVKDGMFLRYGSLEGPENGVYVRGKIEGKSIIELPEYWWNLIDQDTITVNLTPYGRSQDIWVQSTCAHFIHLNQQADCFFTVFAERKDVDKLVVEY